MSREPRRTPPLLSIVVPAYNEADNLPRLLTQTRQTLENYPNLAEQLEWVIVDDHSSDNSMEILATLADPTVRAIRLSRRSGSHVALRAGLREAQGNLALAMAADGQDSALAVPDMMEKWRQGADIVWALHRHREYAGFLNTLFSNLFYWMLARLNGGDDNQKIDVNRGDFFLLDRKVVDGLNACQERQSSLFGLILWSGFNQTFVEYDRPARQKSQSKWTLSRRLTLALDWVVSFSNIPLRIMTVLGLALAIFSAIYFLYVILSWLTGGPPMGWTSIMATMLLLGGVQMVMLGMMSEYLWKNLEETRKRPLYFVERRLAESGRWEERRGPSNQTDTNGTLPPKHDAA